MERKTIKSLEPKLCPMNRVLGEISQYRLELYVAVEGGGNLRLDLEDEKYTDKEKSEK